MKTAVAYVVLGAIAFAISLNSAAAIPAFKKQFDEKYAKEDGTPEQQKLAGEVKRVKCNVCHGKDENGKDSKKVHNAYGKALDELLDKKADVKNIEKINKALETVESLPSNPDDKSSPTFGELLKQGKLPVEE